MYKSSGWTFSFLLGYTPSSGIAGLYGDFRFNFLRNCQTVSQSGCSILEFHQQCVRAAISPHPHHLLLSDFLILSHLSKCEVIFFFFFLAVLGLCCWARAFSSCGEWGLLFVAACGLLIAVASLVAEHGN